LPVPPNGITIFCGNIHKMKRASSLLEQCSPAHLDGNVDVGMLVALGNYSYVQRLWNNALFCFAV
jgi:hypothetical protein